MRPKYLSIEGTEGWGARWSQMEVDLSILTVAPITYAHTYVRMYVRTYVRMYVRMDGRTDGRTDRRMDGQTDGRTYAKK